jgi:hypothetical protein
MCRIQVLLSTKIFSIRDDLALQAKTFETQRDEAATKNQFSRELTRINTNGAWVSFPKNLRGLRRFLGNDTQFPFVSFAFIRG